MTAAKRARKPKPRASGPTQTKSARREAGRVRVEVWLPADVAGKLDDLARDAGSRAEAVAAAIECAAWVRYIDSVASLRPFRGTQAPAIALDVHGLQTQVSRRSAI
jgi:hypothetical protein